jgi:hypothetical protein
MATICLVPLDTSPIQTGDLLLSELKVDIVTGDTLAPIAKQDIVTGSLLAAQAVNGLTPLGDC